MTDRHEIARDFLLQHFKPEELPEVMAHVLEAAGLGDAREWIYGPRLHAALVVAGSVYARDADIDERDVFRSCDAALRAVGWSSFYATRGLSEAEVTEFHRTARGETPP
jgi:hypothetical protein